MKRRPGNVYEAMSGGEEGKAEAESGGAGGTVDGRASIAWERRIVEAANGSGAPVVEQANAYAEEIDAGGTNV